MGQALYRKYRSKSLGEIVGQEHVTTTLANAIKSGRISHAYLLSGPRGVGKTSIARILAHEINGLPYDDESHLDIIEIDAASNRRIDEIRDLRDRVNTAPAHAKYKVYIIDEVHMLTKEAFNALLKTLEEPPAHVIFILATTEAHKLPETIVSRTQRYSLRPVPQDQVIAHLKEIAKGEKIKIDDAALELIAKHGEGSFRDSISLLDQAGSAGGDVTREAVERILGLAPDEYITRLTGALADGDSSTTVATLSDLYAQGFEPAMVAGQLGANIRERLLSDQSTDPGADLRLLERLLDVPAGRNPRLLLEIVLLQTALPKTATPSAPAAPITHVPHPTPVTAPKPVTPEAAETGGTASPAPTKQSPQEIPVATAPVSNTSKEDVPPTVPPDLPVTTNTEDVAEIWQQALEAIKKQYNTLYGIARMAQPAFDGQKLTLSFKFAFHQKRVGEAKNRKLLGDIMQQLCGKPVEIVCVVADGTEAGTAAKPDVSAIANIFGGAELLES